MKYEIGNFVHICGRGTRKLPGLVAKKFLVSREGAAEGRFKRGIPPRPSVPPERSGGGQFSSKKVRVKDIISPPAVLGLR